MGRLGLLMLATSIGFFTLGCPQEKKPELVPSANGETEAKTAEKAKAAEDDRSNEKPEEK